MIKDPERFLGRRNFAAVMQITDDFHDFLMSESPNDFEDIGVIGFDPDTKQIYLKTIPDQNSNQGGARSGLSQPQGVNLYRMEFERSKNCFGILTSNGADPSKQEGRGDPLDEEDGEENVTKIDPNFRFVKYTHTKGGILREKRLILKDSKKQTIILDRSVNLDRLPRARFTLKDDEYEEKRAKLEPNQLKAELFSLFTEYSRLTFDDINREVDQPRGILDEICNKKKERNRTVYFLKNEYLTNDELPVSKKLKT